MKNIGFLMALSLGLSAQAAQPDDLPSAPRVEQRSDIYDSLMLHELSSLKVESADVPPEVARNIPADVGVAIDDQVTNGSPNRCGELSAKKPDLFPPAKISKMARCLIWAESTFNPKARNGQYWGYGQIGPDHCAACNSAVQPKHQVNMCSGPRTRIAENFFNPVFNARCTTHLLCNCLVQFDQKSCERRLFDALDAPAFMSCMR